MTTKGKRATWSISAAVQEGVRCEADLAGVGHTSHMVERLLDRALTYCIGRRSMNERFRTLDALSQLTGIDPAAVFGKALDIGLAALLADTTLLRDLDIDLDVVPRRADLPAR